LIVDGKGDWCRGPARARALIRIGRWSPPDTTPFHQPSTITINPQPPHFPSLRFPIIRYLWRMSHSVRDLPTPALLLDLDILERNLAAMAAKVRSLGASLRPHVKTHKCVEVGRLQAEHGARGITVATIVEAREFAAHGFDDITWAFPLPLSRMREAIELAGRIRLGLTVDSEVAAAALEGAAREAGRQIHVWLEVDCGYHRSGIDPGTPAAEGLARRLAGSSHLVFEGLLTHAGHGYAARGASERAAVARQERESVTRLAHRLRGAGVTVPAVSIGSTPTLAAAESLEGVDEVRPGNYAFYDWMQAAAGVCAPADVAVSVLTTVISHQAGADHCVVDAGALALSKDQGPGAGELRRGYGPVYASLSGAELEPAVNVYALSQEHGFVGANDPAALEDRYAVGARLRVMPNHSCLTAAMFDEYHVMRGQAVVDRWKIRRGR
jgi:D-serine deaminase-like pyridoxal phosphate-dependent protein